MESCTLGMLSTPIPNRHCIKIRGFGFPLHIFALRQYTVQLYIARISLPLVVVEPLELSALGLREVGGVAGQLAREEERQVVLGHGVHVALAGAHLEVGAQLLRQEHRLPLGQRHVQRRRLQARGRVAPVVCIKRFSWKMIDDNLTPSGEGMQDFTYGCFHCTIYCTCARQSLIIIKVRELQYFYLSID